MSKEVSGKKTTNALITIYKRLKYLVNGHRIKKKCYDEDFIPELNLYLFYWKYANSTKDPFLKEAENIGDYLSKVVVTYMVQKHNLTMSQRSGKTLYAIGSILGMRCQNAVVWGSGLINTQKLRLVNAKISNMDICAVRGPKTREELLKIGKKCPPVYGDPAVLMPKVFSPEKLEKKHKITLILHYANENIQIPSHIDFNIISPISTDYRHFITEICQSELVISSSLHGIILAETYGIPAILLLPDETKSFKYEDWYHSTDRYEIRYARSVEEALQLSPMPLPELSAMQDRLEKAFPYYLWDQK